MTHIHKMENEVEYFYWMGSKLLKVHRCKLWECPDQSSDWHQCNQWCTQSKGSSPSHTSLYRDVGGQDTHTAQLQKITLKHSKLFQQATIVITVKKISDTWSLNQALFQLKSIHKHSACSLGIVITFRIYDWMN